MAKTTAAPLAIDPTENLAETSPADPSKPENDNLSRMSPASRRAYIKLRDRQRAKAIAKAK